MHRSILRPTTTSALVAFLALLVCSTGSAQVINEYLANHTGTDDNEYIGIFGQPNTPYANLTLLQIEGDIADGPGTLDSAIPVGTTDGDGYWWTDYLSNVIHNDNYDREHTWPKSYGFSSNSYTNSPYTDCHHLFPADGSYNGARSNKPFDTCDGVCAEWTTEFNNNSGGGAGVYPGNSNWTESNRWETWIGRRGDVARAVMYMAVRYEGDFHGVSGFSEPDLVLTDDAGLIQTTSSSPAYMGLLSTILAWNAEDPVDDLERHRADVVWQNQGNRNPFIDHPRWADCVFALINCGEFFSDGFESGGTGAWAAVAPSPDHS